MNDSTWKKLDRLAFVVAGLVLGLGLVVGGGWVTGTAIAWLATTWPMAVHTIAWILAAVAGVWTVIWGVNILGATGVQAIAAHVKAKEGR